MIGGSWHSPSRGLQEGGGISPSRGSCNENLGNPSQTHPVPGIYLPSRGSCLRRMRAFSYIHFIPCLEYCL